MHAKGPQGCDKLQKAPLLRGPEAGEGRTAPIQAPGGTQVGPAQGLKELGPEVDPSSAPAGLERPG